MQIRKRLKAIASLVPRGSNVIDVGCDHALLDIYLTLYNGNKCIASDINANAYQIAKTNIEKYGLTDKITVVQSNGFEKIDVKDNSTAIICGMGTSTILSILNTNKIKCIQTMILQSNNDLYTLRKTVIKKGYMITNEVVIKERGIFYVLICCTKGHKHYSIIDLWLGPVVRKKEHEIEKEYLNFLLQNYQSIFQKLPRKYIGKKLTLFVKIKKLKKELA